MALTLVGVFCSCSLSKLMDKNPDQAAKECAIRFPVIETVITRDTVIHDTITSVEVITQIPDTVTVECPPSPKATTKKAICPPCKDSIVYKIREIHTNTTTKVRDRAQEQVYMNERDQAREKRDKAQWWLTLCLWILIPLLIAFAIWVYLRIRAGALNSVINKLKNK